ncbi:MAG: [protein-PII] uridylyltransferase [Xanthomonadales bacterium]|nr:[protein-PII] uridylyltransferase [Xanthomonadales bacterium]
MNAQSAAEGFGSPLGQPSSIDWPPLPDKPELGPLRQWLAEVDSRLARGYQQGFDVELLVRERRMAMDLMIVRVWKHFLPNEKKMSLVAVGGYGRGELHPYSDIDLMVLLKRRESRRLKEGLSDFFTFLWDLKLDLGHSVRTIRQAVTAAREDLTVATNLMECRLLTGSGDLVDRLRRSLSPRKLWPGDRFFRAKLQEQRDRHKRYGATAYNLEPNLKEGPGGLRDIQMIAWVAMRHYGARSLSDLVVVGFLDRAEYQALLAGQHFLWRVRYGLHLVAGRKEDRLLFDHQKALAAQFGYRDVGDSNLAVEQFMQAYFRQVMQLERLNERLLQAFDEDILGFGSDAAPESIDDHFQSQGGYLELRHKNRLAERPVLILDLFRVLQENPALKGIRANTSRQIMASVHHLADLRDDAEARAIFAGLWREHQRLPEILERMNRYQVLGTYLPVFGKIVGRMQFDLFHVYTVDQHTLEVLKFVQRFAERDDDPLYPMAHSVYGRLTKPELLYLAAFFHDIAKGRGGDHSELGEADAVQFCQDHGFSEADAHVVAWLVRNHLVMSTTAQRQDIGDPEVVNRFAAEVGDLHLLDYLYLLTLADISGTSPKLWNSWKATLLSELYHLSRDALHRGLENPLQRSEWIEDARSTAMEKLTEAGREATAIEALWQHIPEDYFLRHSAAQIIWQTGLMLDHPDRSRPLVGLREGVESGAAELLVLSPDKDGTFATIVETLGRANLSVVEARAAKTTNAMILDTFQLLDATGSARLEGSTSERIRKRLQTALSRELNPSGGLQKVPARLRTFQKPARVNFRDEPSGNFTELELLCSDQPGLLAAVAHTLLHHRTRIHSARIATFGDQVEDVFVVSDRSNQKLTPEGQAELREALLAVLNPPAPAEATDSEGSGT